MIAQSNVVVVDETNLNINYWNCKGSRSSEAQLSSVLDISFKENPCSRLLTTPSLILCIRVIRCQLLLRWGN